MKKFLLYAIPMLFLLVAGACSPQAPRANYLDIMSLPTAERFQAQEIREYQGARLDPAIGPRDNSISGIPVVDLDTYRLDITGSVDTQRSYTYDAVLAFPSETRLITLHCVEGWQATVLWEGVRLVDLLESAGPSEEARIVIFHCIDGYTTSLTLEEIREKNMLLAFSANGAPLPEPLGRPFIVLAESRYGYKWARWVESMELSTDTNYEGYWEERGFDNDARLPDELLFPAP